jgi:putative MATE family efflux protein
MKKIKTVDFTNGAVATNIIRMYIPLYIAYFCSVIYDIIGSFWVGRLLGEKALAAVSASFPIVMLFSAIVMGATNGVNILLSKYIGAKDEEKIGTILMTSFVSIFIFGVILMLFSLFFIDAILNIGNTPIEIIEIAKIYLIVRIFSFPFIELYMYFAAVLRSYGNSSMQMITVIISTILNAIMDPLFIFLIGINGVAFATLLSQIISMVIMIGYVIKKRIVHFSPKSIRVNDIKEIVKVSIPSAIQQSIPTISVAYIQALFSGFGVAALAAYGVLSKLEIIVQYPGLTINMSETTAIGTCYGAKQTNKISQYLKWGIIFSISLNIVLVPFVTIYANKLSGLFGVSSDATKIVKIYFEIVAIGYLFNCVTNSIMGEMNGMGKQIKSMMLMALYFIIIRFPLAYLLSLTRLGVNGISLSILISYTVAIIIAGLYQFLVINKQFNCKSMT